MGNLLGKFPYTFSIGKYLYTAYRYSSTLPPGMEKSQSYHYDNTKINCNLLSCYHNDRMENFFVFAIGTFFVLENNTFRF